MILKLPFLFLAVLLPVLLSAEEGGSNVTLRVRTVRAAGAPPPAENTEHGYSIDRRLEDVRSKLLQLPYRSFKLLSTLDVPVSLLKKTTIRLDDGQLLNVRLLYSNGKRVGMWVRWSDKDGLELLDSRMHFSCREPMLTGANSTKDSAMILALGVEHEGAAEPVSAPAE